MGGPAVCAFDFVCEHGDVPQIHVRRINEVNHRFRDGKSAETAFVVISTDEEDVVLNFLGLRPAGQSLINQNCHSRTNEAVIYFFNIDKPFNWLGQSLKK